MRNKDGPERPGQCIFTLQSEEEEKHKGQRVKQAREMT